MITAVAFLALSAQAAPQDRISLWKKDIDFVTTELASRHHDLFTRQTEAEWRSSAAQAGQALGAGATQATFAAALMRHIARIGDAHTTLYWQQLGLPAVPVRLDSFADGVFVVRHATGDPRLTGARVVTVAGKKLVEVLAELKPLVPHENQVLLRMKSLPLLSVPGILRELGVTPGSDRVEYGCVARDGEEFRVELAARPAAELRGAKFDSAFTKTPMCLSQPGVLHWFRHLPERKALYLKYDSCSEARKFEQLCKAMWEAVEGEPIERFVLDLRHNSGGNEAVILPLLSGLNRRRELRKGGIYVIIGRETFSSAMNNAITFKTNYRATLVGEATGGKPNHFGETRQLRLPGSRLTVFYSTKFWRRVKDDPPSLEPDVPVELRAAAYFAGEDPFLEAVFSAGK